ncbi:hypothetical protein QPK13_16215 [Photorhabdus tasmaniensis]
MKRNQHVKNIIRTNGYLSVFSLLFYEENLKDNAIKRGVKQLIWQDLSPEKGGDYPKKQKGG